MITPESQILLEEDIVQKVNDELYKQDECRRALSSQFFPKHVPDPILDNPGNSLDVKDSVGVAGHSVR